MLVNDWMNSPVVTINTNETLQKAASLMADKKIGMLPVLDEGKLVGIVTDRDLKRAAPSSIEFLEVKELVYRLAQVRIEHIMTRNPITLLPDTTLEEAAPGSAKTQHLGLPCSRSRRATGGHNH